MALATAKTCRRCKTDKTLDDFYKRSGSRDGVGSWCKLCVNDANRASRAKNPMTSHNRRVYNLRRNYGLSVEAYEKLLKDQHHRCAICRRSDSGHAKTSMLLPDHCHVTGMVRGLLCNNCNTGLGLFKDDTAFLAAAMEYLVGMDR